MSNQVATPNLTSKKDALILKTRKFDKIRSLFPEGSYAILEDRDLAVVPYKDDTIRLLRQSGAALENYDPVYHKRPFPLVKMRHQVLAHQKLAAANAIYHKRTFDLSEARTGKTTTHAIVGNHLQEEKLTRSTLIIAPLSCLKSVWLNELHGLYPMKSSQLLYDTRKTGVKRKLHTRKLLQQHHHFYIINPDGIKVVLDELVAARNAGSFNHVIVDESTEFSNSETARWAALEEIINGGVGVEYLSLLTGTPGNPMKVYGQVKLINRGSVPERPDIWRNKTMQQISQYKWVPRTDAKELIADTLGDKVIRICKRDIYKDMPKELVINRTAPLSDKTKNVLRIIEEDGGMMLNGVEIDPANKAVLQDKILQISSGTLKMPDGDTIRLPIDKKLDALKQIISEGSHKTIVYANYRETVEYLADELGKTYRAAFIHGGINLNERTKIIESFMSDDNDSVEIIIANPLTVSYGVELGLADQAIFWGAPKIDAFKYRQCKERLYSRYQRSDMPAVYLLSSNYLESKMFKALESNDEFQVDVADLKKTLLTGEFFEQ